MPKRADDENEDALRSDVAISTLFDVRGKVVVISGGGSGLGAMMATAFVRNGATVYIFSRKDTSQFAAELTAAGPGTCTAVVADAQRPETVEALVHRCVPPSPLAASSWGSVSFPPKLLFRALAAPKSRSAAPTEPLARRHGEGAGGIRVPAEPELDAGADQGGERLARAVPGHH